MTFIANRDFILEVNKGNVPGHSIIHKFGRNDDIDTGNFPQTVWQVPQGTQALNVFQASVDTIDITSDDADDTAAGVGAQSVFIQGTDLNGDPLTETLATGGLSTVTSLNSYLRDNFLSVDGTGATGTNEGTLSINYTTSGDEIGIILPGDGEMHTAVFTVPNGFTGFMYDISVDTFKQAAVGITVELFLTPTGGPRKSSRTFGLNSQGTSNVEQALSLPFRVESNTDIEFEITQVSASNVSADVDFSMLLIENGLIGTETGPYIS